MGEIPLVAYIDFETTAHSNDFLDAENKKMYAVLYVSYVMYVCVLSKIKI